MCGALEREFYLLSSSYNICEVERRYLSYGNRYDGVICYALAWVPFIEDLSEALTSGLVAGSRDSEEHA